MAFSGVFTPVLAKLSKSFSLIDCGQTSTAFQIRDKDSPATQQTEQDRKSKAPGNGQENNDRENRTVRQHDRL